jgi:hypothetical protein
MQQNSASFALKAQKHLAQGNALGDWAMSEGRPEGAKAFERFILLPLQGVVCT